MRFRTALCISFELILMSKVTSDACRERRQDYEELKRLLIDLPKKVEHAIMVPFGSMAFFPGHLVHTNEARRRFTLVSLLGSRC